MKIKIMTCGDYLCPSSRIRGYYVADYLRKAGYQAEVYPYCSTSGRFLIKMKNATFDLLLKFKATYTNDVSLLFIQKCVNPIPYSTLIFGLILKLFFRKKIIYDIDDAIINRFDFDMVQKFSDVVIVGGNALYLYSKQLNKNTYKIPTCFKEEHLAKKEKIKNGKIVIGFLGSPSTTYYLEQLLNPLSRLAKKYDYVLRIVSATNLNDYNKFNFLSKFKQNKINLEFAPYSVETEYSLMSDFDIGLAPLHLGRWEKYKCGYKVINYMGAGVPPVATDYSEYRLIINDGVNGFLCKGEDEWFHKLCSLIEDDELRRSMAKNAINTVKSKYTFKNYDKLITIINNL